MAQSLMEECTPLKAKYDSCFNAWLETYLMPQPKPANVSQKDWQARISKVKAQEYEEKCGESWRAYSSCVQKAIKTNNLEDLLKQARDENPLPSLSSHTDRSSKS